MIDKLEDALVVSAKVMDGQEDDLTVLAIQFSLDIHSQRSTFLGLDVMRRNLGWRGKCYKMIFNLKRILNFRENQELKINCQGKINWLTKMKDPYCALHHRKSKGSWPYLVQLESLESRYLLPPFPEAEIQFYLLAVVNNKINLSPLSYSVGFTFYKTILER